MTNLRNVVETIRLDAMNKRMLLINQIDDLIHNRFNSVTYGEYFDFDLQLDQAQEASKALDIWLDNLTQKVKDLIHNHQLL